MDVPGIPQTLVVTNDFPPRVGGIQQYVYNLVRCLPPERLTVLAPRWDGWRAFDEAQPFRVVRFPATRVLPFAAARSRVLSLARESGAGAVLLTSGVMSSGFGPCLFRVGIPHIVITHGVEYWAARIPGAAQAMGRSMRYASRVTVISRFIEREVRRAVPGSVPVDMCPPGVDVERFDPGVSGEEVRKRHGLSDRPVVVCISRLVPRKGQDELIEALPAIRERASGAVLLVVGDGPYRHKLASMARQAPAGSVVFAGAVSDEELPQYHAAADVFAMPCRSRWGGLEVEGFGIVYMEAAACGRAAVAGRSGGAGEAVEDEVTGLVVDGRNVDVVASAVGGLLCDPARASVFGVAGRARAVAEFSWPSIASRVTRWLREAAS